MMARHIKRRWFNDAVQCQKRQTASIKGSMGCPSIVSATVQTRANASRKPTSDLQRDKPLPKNLAHLVLPAHPTRCGICCILGHGRHYPIKSSPSAEVTPNTCADAHARQTRQTAIGPVVKASGCRQAVDTQYNKKYRTRSFEQPKQPDPRTAHVHTPASARTHTGTRVKQQGSNSGASVKRCPCNTNRCPSVDVRVVTVRGTSALL